MSRHTTLLRGCVATFFALTTAIQAQYTLSTVAGRWPEPAIAREIAFLPLSIALDGSGNLYIASQFRIHRILPDGSLATLAGTGHFGEFRSEGPATQVPISLTDGNLAVGPTGDLYFFEGLSKLRRVNVASGQITTIPDPDSLLTGGGWLAIDSSGNIFVASTFRDRIQRVDAITSAITTVAGTGVRGFAGDGRAATDALLNQPTGLVIDANGNFLFMDGGNRIRKIAVATGIISTLAGTGVTASQGDNGPATLAQISSQTLALDAAGNLYVGGFGTIRKISAQTGVITAIAGNRTGLHSGDGGPAASAGIGLVRDLAVDAHGNIFVAESNEHKIRKIDAATQIIETIAGGEGGDGGPALLAQLNLPQGPAFDSKGNLYVVDDFGRSIRRVDAQTGVITKVAGAGHAFFPSGDGNIATATTLGGMRRIVFDRSGNLIFTESCSIRKIDAVTRIVTTLVGGRNCNANSNDSYPALGSNMATPLALAIDASGTLYFSDRSRVRKLAVGSSMVTTVAGSSQSGDTGDGGLARNALLTQVEDMAIDPRGDLFIATSSRIRKIDHETGLISTLAQMAATSIGLGPTGLLYVSDLSRIWKLDPATQTLMFIGGGGGQGYSNDGSPAAGARFGQLAGLAVDTHGSVFLADSFDRSVRQLTPPPVILESVTNGASNQPGPIAPGEVVVLYGSGLGSTTLTFKLDGANRIAKDAAGTRVLFNGTPSPILYTLDRQVSAIVPYTISSSTVDVAVEVEGRVSSARTVPVASSNPALFTSDSTGIGRAAALNQDGTLNSSSNGAAIGSFVSLFATGEGLTTPVPPDGSLASAPYPKPLLAVTATVDGIPAAVQYAGAAPGQVAGLFQINIQIPATVKPGLFVPVEIKVGETSSQAGVTISIRP